MNRLQEPSEGERCPAAADYFIVAGRSSVWFVSTVMAQHIEFCLDAGLINDWVRFVDLAGSRIRIRASHIESIVQCTAAQRADDRALTRALRDERKADRSWDEDEMY